MTVNETEDKTVNTEIETEIEKENETEIKEEGQPVLDDAQIRAAALAYAKFLSDNNLTPGEPAFGVPEEAGSGEDTEKSEASETEENSAEAGADKGEPSDPENEGKSNKEKSEAVKAAELERIRKREEAKARNKEKFLRTRTDSLASVMNLHDKVQDGIDGTLSKLGMDIIRGAHSIASTYKNSRRGIGIAILVTGLLAAGILIIFDYFTVYEYAYNGKVLGYVKNQEEVTDVLDIAGRQLTYNSSTEADVKFVANQNVTFNPVDGRGKSTDDSDTVVNKLIYMTDIETEAYAVYDGDKVVAIVKDQNDADSLLLQTKADLSIPDRGMELVSAEFTNELSVKPVNVLLGSVQSNVAAQNQMTSGGEMNTYHIVEEGETLESLASDFGVEVFEIYDEENKEPVTEIEQGDRVCIRCHVDPVSVKMVEEGKLKEVIEYKTIKKETDEYYKGDSYLKQEGQDGIQIFEGVITKVGGEVTKRKQTAEPVTLKKKKDKIILVGTAERPKTAATGTFIVPLDHYVVTSEWGGRWGRLHEGMDLAAPTGTPIHASDGGKIIKANYWSGHGLCVEVDHGNGVVTRYSHCSAVFVSIGDLVYQGQHIANVGNTGHSFGSHCHFEVRVNDVSQNPRNYINP
ncbi:MAG: peptidoglycan DD-metalloendopeptidase family protein [Mogibacterium sp.]|nr:peptidoglycan DD-metalloendopeptidase family protein [Mogibacterium sp.]